jgi:hypothetical protein
MSATATAEPLEVDEQLVRGRADLEGADPSERDAGGGSVNGGDPPPLPPPVDRDERPERPPRWQRWMVAGFLLVCLLVCGIRLGAEIERARLERKR